VTIVTVELVIQEENDGGINKKKIMKVARCF
jgi:hypothetical protein